MFQNSKKLYFIDRDLLMEQLCASVTFTDRMAIHFGVISLCASFFDEDENGFYDRDFFMHQLLS